MRKRMKEIRKQKGMTQEELAILVGIERSSITNIERGKKTPSLKVAIRIKEVLEYDRDDIFYVDDD